jgi:hypothetical protein
MHVEVLIYNADIWPCLFCCNAYSNELENFAKFQGANILVDNKGCIKLADFGASKQVAKLVRSK